MDALTRLTKKENEIKTASPIIDAEARTLYETKGFKEYTLRGIKKIMKAYKGLEEAQRILLEALQAHSISIETQHSGTHYAKCSTAVVEWGAFLGGLQKTLVESLDFSVVKPLELLTNKEIPEVLNQKKKFDNVAKEYQTVLNTNPNKRSKDDIDRAKGSYYKKGDEVHQLINDENDHLAVKTLEEQCYILELYLQYFKGGYTYLSKAHADMVAFRKFSADEKQVNAAKSANIKSGEWVPDSILEKPTVRVFNVPLREVVEREGSPSNVPSIIEKAVQIIERKGLMQQGIFRISANKVLLDSIQKKFEEGGTVNFEEWDGHTAAGVIKAYLRALPECLVTNELYNDFIYTGDMIPDAQPARLKELIAKLPPANYATLKCIMGLCSKITMHEKDNMMGPDNIATVLAPTVMFSKDDSLGDILEMIKRGNIVLSTMVKNYNDLFEAGWNKAVLDTESPRGLAVLVGGPAKAIPPPVPKAPPKFAYPQPTHTRPVADAVPLEDDDESRSPAPAVPKRPMRKRSLSTGDETEVEEWRAQNNIAPQARAKAPQPPKKPLYGAGLPDLGAKLGTTALTKTPKPLPPGVSKTNVPKVGNITAAQATQQDEKDNVSPLPASPRNHQKFNSDGAPSNAISPRSHTKVQSSGGTPGAIQSPGANAKQAPIVSPRPGLVRAATANPAGHAKVAASGPPVVPQPIQSTVDSPKASSAPSNLSYLEYDLQAVIDLANQFIGTTLQTLTPNITVDDLNAINRLLKQVTQSTAQYISTIKQNMAKLPQYSNELTAFARALRDSVNIVIADFKIVCNNVSEDTQNLPAAIDKCVQSIDQLSRACYYNGALLTHLLQSDEFETVKVNVSSSVNKLVTALRDKSKAVISECVYELASLASRLHAFANARGVEAPEVRAIIEPLQTFTKEVQVVCKQAAVIGEDPNVAQDTINGVIEKANNVVKSLAPLKLPPPKQRYTVEDQALFLKKTREELARLTEFEEKFNSHRLVRMLITNLNKLASSLEVVQNKYNNDQLKNWIVDGFSVCGALLSIQNLISNTAKSCPDPTLKDILTQYKGILQTNIFRMRVALFGQFHRDQSIAADPSLVELGTKCNEFEINLFTELKNFVYGARPFIFNFNEAITKILE